MRRREFIAAVWGAAAWPLAARAQQTKRLRLGYLEPGARTDADVQNLRRQFLLGLRDLGYVPDRDFELEDRFAEGQSDRLPALAAELVRLPVDMIIAGGDAPIRAASQATDKIPIVMTIAADPVGSGFAASLARPGGNITGLSGLASEMAGKRVELLKEILPRASRVAVLWNPENASKVVEWHDTESAARQLGIALHSFEARTPGELDTALTTLAHDHQDGMIVFVESLTIANRGRIGSFALANRVPMLAEIREFASAGGIASYGVSRTDVWRRAASYVDKIVRGAKAGDLPIEQPTRFELVINLNAARAIGVEIPGTILARADEVIE